jgi:uncharacterized protein YeaO (DUF488 family)
MASTLCSLVVPGLRLIFADRFAKRNQAGTCDRFIKEETFATFRILDLILCPRQPSVSRLFRIVSITTDDVVAIRIVRLGSAREPDEGLRIGTVRRPPRGVRKDEYATRDIYDVWFPNLAPSQALLKEVFPVVDERSWKSFKRKFLAEMKSPEASRDLDLLAALSHQTNFSVGCYCKDETKCHRSVLRELLEGRGAHMK